MDEVTAAFGNDRSSTPLLIGQFGQTLIVVMPMRIYVLLDQCLRKSETFLQREGLSAMRVASEHSVDITNLVLQSKNIPVVANDCQ